jgi:phytoene dehydrogenase-like protein
VPAVLLDTSPGGFVAMAGNQLPEGYRRWVRRYHHGPGVFKIDWVLSEPVPWTNPDVRRAGTIHVAGTMEETIAGESAPAHGRLADRPYVLAVQPTVVDPTRAPDGGHVFWAYVHVPHGSTVDMTEAIEAQVERFAPGFRERIVGQHVTTPAEFESYNPNYSGGDIAGGANDIRQIVFRPRVALDPYSTGIPGVYLCSSATPPGAGVHGMAGHNAAKRAMKYLSR